MPQLLRELKKHYARHGRSHLPWRRTRDPYKILVSEIMLQQTQVERVIPFYAEFMRRYPTAHALAQAPLRDVLAAWQGLGYNRRAKYLWASAKVLCSGEINTTPTPPQSTFATAKLPGVGPYTRGAVLAFAFNEQVVIIETNIRTVFLHHVGQGRVMSDAQLLPLVADALKKSKMQPRDFYAALMDYGSHLKRQGIKLNAQSKHYTKQSAFKGSARELRGAIVREILGGPQTVVALSTKLAKPKGQVEREVARLKKESLVSVSRNKVSVYTKMS